jgi:type IV secretory pathway TrbD component
MVVPGSIPNMMRSFANFYFRYFATMISIPHKAKQFTVFIIKLLIVTAAFYFIWNQLVHNDKLDWTKFIALLKEKQSVWGILFLLSFSVANRFLEILKWQNLVSFFKPISVGESTKQVLGALTAGIFTPNGLGEYAGKALFFEKIKTKKIIFLNLICNGIQMILTIIFGTIGLLILGYKSWVLGIVLFAFAFWLLAHFSKNIKIKSYSIQKLIHKINEIPKNIHQKNILLATCRYLVFSHQYYFLFLAFDVDLPYLTLMATIATVYFLASSLPSFQFLDFAVKGSVAVFFFGKLGVNEWIVVFISTLMWFLNVVLPVVIGSYYVLKFKPKWK